MLPKSKCSALVFHDKIRSCVLLDEVSLSVLSSTRSMVEFVVGDNKVRLDSKLGNDSEEGGSLTDGGGTNGACKGILHV